MCWSASFMWRGEGASEGMLHASAEKSVKDDESTAQVVWLAAERIGKGTMTAQTEQLQRICDYLITTHWFQTAGDLRVALQNVHEWHQLEVPARLKIAIQEVLDEYNPPPYDAAAYSTEYTLPFADQAAAAEAAWYASSFENYEYYYAQQPTEMVTTDCNVIAPSGATPAVVASIAVDEVVEAYAVAENASAECHGIPIDNVELYESVPVHAPPKTVWACRQCTYLNPIAESFCGMCCDHISLSPDYASLASDVEWTPSYGAEPTQATQAPGLEKMQQQSRSIIVPAIEIPHRDSVPSSSGDVGSPTVEPYSPTAPPCEDIDFMSRYQHTKTPVRHAPFTDSDAKKLAFGSGSWASGCSSAVEDFNTGNDIGDDEDGDGGDVHEHTIATAGPVDEVVTSPINSDPQRPSPTVLVRLPWKQTKTKSRRQQYAIHHMDESSHSSDTKQSTVRVASLNASAADEDVNFLTLAFGGASVKPDANHQPPPPPPCLTVQDQVTAVDNRQRQRITSVTL
ncbi:TPA: LOW QUALITY PROTEIN: hypothetical protein N0F65_003541 [Lagenidium giganteum]|uniref:RanBP2-type domain-containing protein n=1 Tax=Lagenidium giganteum TaxID=4803 RepID=A0AAV2Z2A3_9STRA|nr:TPA: LOW QUALITY PROTEIN: hypothetical protein N0F65_003541 [Lagenidium giganteum]